MAEIRSLKRILTADTSIKHFCVIDEVLRGTNTIERIAASSRILKALSDQGIYCIAATHDIELTTILEDCFDNYHFREIIENDDILFDYRLQPGPSRTRNAIRLLDVMGFDKRITEEALAAASEFERNGRWLPLKGE